VRQTFSIIPKAVTWATFFFMGSESNMIGYWRQRPVTLSPAALSGAGEGGGAWPTIIQGTPSSPFRPNPARPEPPRTCATSRRGRVSPGLPINLTLEDYDQLHSRRIHSYSLVDKHGKFRRSNFRPLAFHLWSPRRAQRGTPSVESNRPLLCPT